MAKTRLTEETWGDRLHRAYRTCREKHGLVYADHADAISQFFPLAESVLLRLEDQLDVPSRPNTRLRAYMALLAYGFDPADFGLSKDNVPLSGWNMRLVESGLDPNKRTRGDRSKKTCSPNSDRRIRPNEDARNRRSAA